MPTSGSTCGKIERHVRSTDIVQWPFLLAYPATLVWVPLFAYGPTRRAFVSGGRHR